MQNYKKVYKHTLQVGQNIYKGLNSAEQAESVVQAGHQGDRVEATEAEPDQEQDQAEEAGDDQQTSVHEQRHGQEGGTQSGEQSLQ